MQIKKSEIRSRIVRTARLEFSRQGFHHTSMRSIASKSQITTSNIYNYFKSKEILLEEIVRPTLSRIMGTLEDMEHVDHSTNKDMFGYSNLEKQFDGVIHFIDSHRDDLKLILFKSSGSDIQNLKENFINRYTEIIFNQLLFQKKNISELRKEISRFFVHNLCSLYMNVITEIVMHDISLEKMKEYVKEFLTFVYYGIRALMGVSDTH